MTPHATRLCLMTYGTNTYHHHRRPGRNDSAHHGSKEDVQALDKKVQALDTKVTAGFERIEHLLLEEQRRKIEHLETRMKKLEDALAI